MFWKHSKSLVLRQELLGERPERRQAFGDFE
jgi:hypothetical protein